jgi:hypothetical protein
MDPLCAAIMTLFNAGGDFYNDISGRLYCEDVPEGVFDLPYAVFFIVSNSPEYPGGKTIEQTMIQFSLFCSAANSAQANKHILGHLWALFDDCILTVAGYSEIFFIRGNLSTARDEIVTSAGTVGIRQYDQEYNLQIVK